MDTILQDVRYGVRSLLKHPLFAAIAVTTIALGIGANTAIFSLANGVLLRPLPLQEPQRLVVPDVIAPTGFEISLSIPNFKDWRSRNRTFESFGANARRQRTLTGSERPERVVTRLVLGDFFETLGVAPAKGRLISSEETRAGAAPIAVVTHGFWTRHLGADPQPLGRTITLDGESFDVVGVMPAGFQFPSADTEVFVPMGYFSEHMCWEERDCSQGTWAIGRLRVGVTLAAAQADLERIAREIADEEGEEVAVARLSTLADAYVGDIRTHIWVLMGAVAFVLLIACGNVAGLLIARGEARRREVAVRNALGASSGRIARQFLTEAVLLATAGGVLGVGLAHLGLRLLIPAVSDDIPSAFLGRIAIDPLVLAFTLTLTLGAGLIFGLVPALRLTRGGDIGTDLREGGNRGGTVGLGRQRLRAALVVMEVALSAVLLIGAGLMVQSLRSLQNVDKGFDASNVLTAEVSLPRIRYDDQDAAWQFFEELLGRVQSLPGVRSASLTQIVPLEGNSWERGIIPEGVADVQENYQSVLFHMVTPGHFATFGIPILRGRGFTDADRAGSGELVAVIDETMAEKFWPGEDPIGKRVTFESAPGSDPENPEHLYRTVIGVVRNVRHYELENPSRIQVYVPMAQSGESWTTAMTVAVKTSGDPTALVEPIRRELSRLDPEVPLDEIQTMEGYVKEAMSDTRLVSGLLTIFSLLALFLSAIGLFGVISYSVIQRVREIGIRMALGARASDVLRMVSAQGLILTLAGLLIGLIGALALTRLMTGLLYGVEPLDPVTYAAVSAFLVTVAISAIYLPARRATRVDPATILREE
jgi:putative ABC transport system permease protein